MAEYLKKALPPTAELPQHLGVDDAAVVSATAKEKDDYMTTTSTKDTKSRQANGRSFHGYDEDAYFLPNDQLEAARLDLQHYTWKMMMNGHLSIVPINKDLKRILDVGTGTGIWCLEIAKEHPEVQVTGTDLSAIQPASMPQNCHFIQANAEHDWSFGSKFDFIHSRMLTMGMHDWPRYFKQCWEHLEPGGWIQTGETQFPQKRADAEFNDASPSAVIQWGQYCYDAASKAGINARASEDFDEMLKAQGFVNVQSYDVQWPMGSWAKGEKNKALGRLIYENMRKAVPALCAGLFPTLLGWEKERVDAFVVEVVEDMDKGHYYCPMVCHVAQKPFDK